MHSTILHLCLRATHKTGLKLLQHTLLFAKYPASAKLQKIETHSCWVIQNKHKQAMHAYIVVCTI